MTRSMQFINLEVFLYIQHDNNFSVGMEKVVRALSYIDALN